VAGGVASTQRWKGYWFNDGVQGGAPCYANTFRLHAAAGFEPRPVHMTINFGKGPMISCASCARKFGVSGSYWNE
jgi:hypothetical protein